MFKSQKKEKIWKLEKKEIFYINLHLRGRLEKEFTACYDELMP